MESQVFDYIVVGAGSAGSVLANRLSADPKHQVMVLEAGRESHPRSRIPVGFAKLIQNPAANWLYASEPDDGTGQRRIPARALQLGALRGRGVVLLVGLAGSCEAPLIIRHLSSHCETRIHDTSISIRRAPPGWPDLGIQT